MSMGSGERTAIALLDYYARNRRVGHTHAMIVGARDMPEALVVVETHAMIDHMRDHGAPIDCLPLSKIIKAGLWGMERPLLVDHAALCTILRNMLREQSELRRQIAELTVDRRIEAP